MSDFLPAVNLTKNCHSWSRITPKFCTCTTYGIGSRFCFISYSGSMNKMYFSLSWRISGLLRNSSHVKILMSGSLASRINCGGHSVQALVWPWILNILSKFWRPFLGNLEMLREKVLSIPGHLTNTHVFPGNKYHDSCQHGDLSKAWLSPDSKVRFSISNLHFIKP